VTNPAALPHEDVGRDASPLIMANSAVNEFQREFSFLVWTGAVFSDEAVNGHNFQQWRDIDLRLVEDNNTQLNLVYLAVQRARATGDLMAEYLRDRVDPLTSLHLATALVYSGYSHIYLAEYFCFAPMGPDQAPIRSAAIHALAVQRFQEAIEIAQRNTGAEATRLLNMARVGAARASLQQGKMAEAIAFASEVPAAFAAWSRSAETPTAYRNWMYSATQGNNRTIGVDPSFRGLNDRRVRHNATAQAGHNTTITVHIPFQGPSHGGWRADGVNVPFADTTSIRLASGLEARYIIAEAGGMSDAELLAFINERRAVGGQAVPFVGTDLQAELRDQRRRDFFMDGHRLGDIRRYRNRHNIDFFPSGEHPFNTVGWGTYFEATCLIPHQNERIGNPNYQLLQPLDQ
jgi:hypothetical protein